MGMKRRIASETSVKKTHVEFTLKNMPLADRYSVAIDLVNLVEHRESVAANSTIGDFVQRLGSTNVSYVAVCEDDAVIGVISRESIGVILSGRYGFALFADKPVRTQMEPDFLAFRRSTPLLDLLAAALNREGRLFQIDVVLLADDDRYLGMIPVRRLARLQSQLLEEHIAELERQKERYTDLVENANDIIFTLDLDGRFVSLNKAGERITGYGLDEARKMRVYDVIAAENHELVRQMLSQKLDGSPRTTYEIEVRARDGTQLSLEVSSRLIFQDSKAVGVQGIARDITERRSSEARLRHNALHDALTGLPNRTLFFSQLESATERQKRHDEVHFAVLLLDLDRFKIVNDSLGHLAGDRLLVAAAEKVKRCVRSVDTVARFGGDEFTVLLSDISNINEAVHVTERILAEFTKPVDIDGHEIFSSVSVGVAIATPDTVPEALLREADTAMYVAKFSGRARYQVFDPSMHRRARNLLTIENELRRALDRGEFELRYQPIVSLSGGEIVGFEALLRWRHSERGLVGPSEFIPIAEDTGLIVPIGRWVLREACTQLMRWRKDGFHRDDLIISVNLSVKQLVQQDFAEEVARIIRETGVSPSFLNLEITESAIIGNPDTALKVLSDLKQLGVRLSTDDFGTGYSSLSYLHRFPISQLKIDRSFICNMNTRGESAEIVRTILTLGRSLGMEVVAEGVENQAQLTLLREFQCELAQGYLFSEPVTDVAAGELLAKSHSFQSPRL